MNDPRLEAQQTLDSLLSRAKKEALDAVACDAMLERVALVPGYVKAVAHALSAQRSAPAVEALRCMPPNVPGVVEGLYQAFYHGVTRRRIDGSSCEPMLAIDFRRSRSKGMEQVIERAQAVFAESFEALRVSGNIVYRFGIFGTRGTLAGRAAAMAQDLKWLHGRLGRLKGTRLWINGWCFETDGPFRAPVQVHLVHAWLSWAATQIETRGR